MIKKYITVYVTIGAFFITSTNFNLFQAQAQTARVIDEIVVTSRKRTESSQDVPLPLVALREESLEELGINVFEDYLLQLPSVTAGGISTCRSIRFSACKASMWLGSCRAMAIASIFNPAHGLRR